MHDYGISVAVIAVNILMFRFADSSRDINIRIFKGPNSVPGEDLNAIYTGDRFELVCKAPPGRKVKWYCNDVEHLVYHMTLPNEENITQINVDEKFGGDYTCETEDGQWRSDVLHVKIETPVAPILVNENSRNILTLYGRPINLKCHYKGVPEPMVTWLKNGEPISRDVYKAYPLGRTSELFIENALMRDDGQYTCVVKNRAGSTNTSFVVEVRNKECEGLVLDQSEKTITIEEGEPLNISVVLLNENTILGATTWQKKTIDPRNPIPTLKEIKPKIESKDAKRKTQTIVIEQSTLEDSGEHFLQHPSCGQLATWNVHVTRKMIVPELTIEAEVNKSVVLLGKTFFSNGSEITVSCIVKTLPPPAVTLKYRRKWSSDKDWVHVPSPRQLTGTYENGVGGRLIEDDDLEFLCISERGQMRHTTNTTARIVGSDFGITLHHAQHELDAYEEPKSTVIAGDNIELKCSVPHNVEWMVTWLFKGRPLNFTRLETLGRMETRVLYLQSVKQSDNGSYACLVKHDSQTESFWYEIEVENPNPPSIETSEKENEDGKADVKVQFGEDKSLTCDSEGDPKPIIYWCKDDCNATIANGSIYTLKKANSQDDGTYTCMAKNRAGNITKQFYVTVEGAPLSTKAIWMLIVLVVVIVVILIVGALLVTWARTKRLEAQEIEAYRIAIVNDFRTVVAEENFAIEEGNLWIDEILGAGQFGEVYLGELTIMGTPIKCAVKKPKRNFESEIAALQSEVEILVKLAGAGNAPHPNILAFLGATIGESLCAVFELCEHGDLLNFLRSCKKYNDNKRRVGNGYIVSWPANSTITAKTETQSPLLCTESISTSHLVCYAMQIASGMKFLASIPNMPFLHRDLAARNCLLTSDGVVKIADFGLTRSDQKGYYRIKSQNALIPVRWSAPEVLEEQKSTVESDVWSFGIVLFEIFSMGAEPYDGNNNREWLQEIIAMGQRNKQPEFADDDVYELMLTTWEYDPHSRPTFDHCHEFLADKLYKVDEKLLYQLNDALNRATKDVALLEKKRKEDKVSHYEQGVLLPEISQKKHLLMC